MTITPLDANQPPGRFYKGGARIDRFRGVPEGVEFRPEDWVASVTTVAGEATLGLTVLPSGETLAAAVTADPEAWLGKRHVAAFGPSTMLLVKLLDAGQRLPVHAHPDDDFSRTHLHIPFGKAEAWYILDGGRIHIGLTRSIDRSELLSLVKTQDTSALIALLHTREVSAGDVVFVPPGELHAIGAGVLLLELQQPTDLSILLEWDGFELDGEQVGHLGLGFDVALKAVRTDARTADEIDSLIAPVADGTNVLPRLSERYFRLERRVVKGSLTVERGFAVVVAEHGTATVEPLVGEPLEISRGATVVAPHAAGDLTLTGDATVLVCRPPSA